MQNNTADAEMTVLASRHAVTRGESFAYLVIVKNTGDIPLARCVLSSQIPPTLCVVKLEMDGVMLQTDYACGITIENLDCAQSRVLIVTVKTTETFPISVYHHLVQGSFESIADGTEQPIRFNKTAQDKEGLNMMLPKLTMLMSVDYPESAVGEIVTYTLAAKNDGNVALTQIVIVNTLPPPLKFITGSVYIDGIKQIAESIVTGIGLSTLAVSETRIICFEAEIISRSEGVLVNQARSTFAYCDAQTGQAKQENVCSNPVALRLYLPRLSVTKTVDKPIALLGDSMHYTVKLTNEGDIPAEDVLFMDRLPNCLELIDGSFSVDQQIIHSVRMHDGIRLDNILPGSSKTVAYRTQVISTDCGGTIKNEASADFAYGMQQGRRKRMYTELAVIESPVAISLFQQVTLQQNFTLQEKRPEIKHINHVNCTSEMTHCSVIETAQGTSLEGQHLTGRKLIVHGSLDLAIEYTANKESETIHFMTYRLPFSTFIVLPPDCKQNVKRDVHVSLEGIYYKMCSSKEFFVYGILLVTCNMTKQRFSNEQ